VEGIIVGWFASPQAAGRHQGQQQRGKRGRKQNFETVAEKFCFQFTAAVTALMASIVVELTP
jgi:hypothetical protein